jgi:hyaluronan synthase/N-acetylglucosaminyltransferase
VISIGFDFLLAVLRRAFLFYTLLMLLHLVVQTALAHVSFRQSVRRSQYVRLRPALPDVDVIVPVYNENPSDLTACCEAILAQTYRGLIQVYLVDDGSPNRAELRPVYERFSALPGWHVLLPEQNAGKRAAQDLAVRASSGALVVTIDSDTQIAPDGIEVIARVFEDDRRIGAVTGDVRVANAGHNLLTRLIDIRYWVAFNQERAGPFAVYRRDVLDRIWDRYVAQTFRGTECTYGDDRHLTNLVLAEGLRTTFEPAARAITSAPTTMPTYLRQQLRWNKSYYRELLWTLSFLPRLSLYMTFEVLTQTMLPLLLVLAVATTAVRVVQQPAHLLAYALVITGVALLHCAYALWRTRDPRFLLFVVYGFIHAGLLIPLRLRAISTLTNNSWGTRGEAPAAALNTSGQAFAAR